MADKTGPRIPRDFLTQYHAEVVCSMPEEEVEKFRVRLGANLLQPFIDNLGEEPLSLPELKERLETYLRDELQMADFAEVTASGGELAVEIKGCHLCFGNDLLRDKGKKGCCPFAPGINRAISRALNQSGRLQGVDKTPGVTGECVIRYQVS
jgi:hypothetical protein